MKSVGRMRQAQYLAFEDQIASTAEGRAFLRERDRRAQVVAAAEVRGLMRRLLLTPEGEEERKSAAHMQILRRELQEMGSYIQRTRDEIAALEPDDAGNNRIVAATGELDAIVSATERATSEILNAAERIQKACGEIKASGAPGAPLGEIEAQVIEIMTACSFQDITGQRTTKVVNTLRYIEQRVLSMISIWGSSGESSSRRPAEPADTRPDAHLLNGPALHGGMSQNDIDALLNGDGFAAAPPPAEPMDQAAIDALMG